MSSANQQDMAALATMVGAPGEPLALSCGRVQVTPIKVKELPKFLAALQPFFGEVMRLADGGEFSNEEVMQLLASHTEQVIKATCIGARLARDTVDALDIDELVLLITEIVVVNADFFARRLQPAVAAASQRTAQTLGSTPLNGSSAPATGTVN